MRLIDCFYKVLSTLVEFRDTIQKGESPSYEAVRLPIERALSERSQQYLLGGYNEQQYNRARYAVLAFIDEAILSTAWPHKLAWKRELMQEQVFDSVDGGEKFFDLLNELSPTNPADKDVREVFYYCLTLGFKGKYYSPENALQLDMIKRSTFALLTEGMDQPDPYNKRPLFPTAYQPGGEEGTPPHRTKSVKVYAFGGAIVFLLVEFFFMRSVLTTMTNYFVSTI